MTVNLNCCVTAPDTFDALTVYVVIDCAFVGAPDNAPNDVLNDIPEGAEGEIEYVAAPPVALTVKPAAEP